MRRFHLEQRYRGYRISGSAEIVHNDSRRYFTVGEVTLHRKDKTVTEVYRFQDSVVTDDDEQRAAWFGLGLAEIAVDHLVPPATYYLTPMNTAWAVDILRRGADEFMQREIRLPKLYEALDYLEKTLDKVWLVKRYRRALRGDCRNWRERNDKRENLRIAARGIQRACAEQLVERMNELAADGFRRNKAKIERLSRVLQILRFGSKMRL